VQVLPLELLVAKALTSIFVTALSPVPSDATGDEYYDSFTGIPNNAGSGVTGDIDFTTVGHSSGDSYHIILEMVKNY